MNHRNTVLFIGHLWPEPTSSAAGYRTLALLEALLKQYSIHFACAADKSEYCADLDRLGITSVSIQLNHASFDEYLQQLQPDIVFYDRFITEEQFAPRVHDVCPDAINILDTQDLHFLRRARQKALQSGQSIDLYSDDAIREIAAILRCDLSLIISRYEIQLLTEQFHLSPEILHYCPFMLDLDESVCEPRSYYEREHFVMIGNFLHPPNWDAVLWCYQALWSPIRAQLPQAQLHIYGAYPSEKVYQLHQPKKGVIIQGRAEHALETLSHYRVNLAPLRFGAGIKGKIADGFIAQTPCVTTPIGCEGMGFASTDNVAQGGRVIDSMDDTQQFIQYAIELYQNPSLWQDYSDSAPLLIQKHFDKQQHSHYFTQRLEDLIATLKTHRQHNFIGQILNHNLYRSQYFMSKWIEEKNK
ncbi:MAG: glycosyltransferase [Gammaproteobacteria bacterium]|nr:glycosyltransferase [Gammaproteobacteria bacterium]